MDVHLVNVESIAVVVPFRFVPDHQFQWAQVAYPVLSSGRSRMNRELKMKLSLCITDWHQNRDSLFPFGLCVFPSPNHGKENPTYATESLIMEFSLGWTYQKPCKAV
jgi:hypothetical protein